MQTYLFALKKAVQNPPYPQPNWGNMDFQNMIEHLKITFDMLFKDIKCVTPAEKLPRQQAFLRSDRAMPQNFKTPLLPQDPLPHKFENPAEAINQLEKSCDRYLTFWRENPEANVMNPIFGELDQEMWFRFHIKHLNHHFAQFSIVVENS